MPRTYSLQFPVRVHDCDPYAHLATANYLRFLDEADLAAMSAIGSGQDRLTSFGLTWQPKSTYIEFLRPLTLAGELEITTRLVGMRENRSLRAYEFRAPDSEIPSATATVEWYLADSTTGQATQGQPTGLDLSPVREESQGGSSATFTPPPLPPKPKGVFSQTRTVQWSEVNPSFQLAYDSSAKYLIDCSVQAGDSCGWSIKRAQAEGIAYVARRLWIDHKSTAFLGDQLRLSSWISKPKRSTIMRHYLLERVADNALVEEAHILWVCVDVRNGRPVHHLQGWQDALSSQISEDDLEIAAG